MGLPLCGACQLAGLPVGAAGEFGRSGFLVSIVTAVIC